ncbi:hypothetical protein BDP55DRAFT_633697 [Colletotrichum godetiae]|uniref:Uncharacterized protein n=1 Tax=Colletotrichum godetiae TaxID=1209918 RepID=A0AAJ0EW01_9PEZI|nr:uncharacterized protein BDP55DRAFT_633697 [Colletotrichum godetiae]KAK1673750.1 hypothetical protein BDP55DRAFT_633697 [Colletotrichum godetiae]
MQLLGPRPDATTDWLAGCPLCNTKNHNWERNVTEAAEGLCIGTRDCFGEADEADKARKPSGRRDEAVVSERSEALCKALDIITTLLGDNAGQDRLGSAVGFGLLDVWHMNCTGQGSEFDVSMVWVTLSLEMGGLQHGKATLPSIWTLTRPPAYRPHCDEHCGRQISALWEGDVRYVVSIQHNASTDNFTRGILHVAHFAWNIENAIPPATVVAQLYPTTAVGSSRQQPHPTSRLGVVRMQSPSTLLWLVASCLTGVGIVLKNPPIEDIRGHSMPLGEL